jgi:hypothetical protein
VGTAIANNIILVLLKDDWRSYTVSIFVVSGQMTNGELYFGGLIIMHTM